MTDTASRAARPRRLAVPADGGPAGGAPADDGTTTWVVRDERAAPVAGLAAAAWAAVLGLVGIGLPVLLAWVAAPHGEATGDDAVRFAGMAWLAAHHVPLPLAGGTGSSVSLLPLGLMLVPLLLLHRAGRWAARTAHVQGGPDGGLLVAAGTAVYAGAGAVLAAVVGASPLAGLAWCAGVAAVGLGSGVVAVAPEVRLALAAVPFVVRQVVRAALVAVAALVAAAALVLAGALLAHLSAVGALAQVSGAGMLGGALLAVLGVLYVPNAVVWTASYLAGPGFAFGVGTSVSPFGVELGAVPALPLVAAVPADAPRWAWALLLLPFLAGLLGGRVLARSGAADDPASLRGALQLVGVGLLSGVLVALVCLLAGGALGDERLAVTGPDPLVCGLAVAALTGAGALGGGLTVIWRGEIVVDLRSPGRSLRALRVPRPRLPRPALRRPSLRLRRPALRLPALRVRGSRDAQGPEGP